MPLSPVERVVSAPLLAGSGSVLARHRSPIMAERLPDRTEGTVRHCPAYLSKRANALAVIFANDLALFFS
jgi:hypothetical protein